VHRADLIFRGVEQASGSFEGRVFLNNPSANANTPKTPGEGYAGSFHVYGYGEPAPPAIADAKARRQTGESAVAPIEKRLHADAVAVRSALERASELTVTVVSVPIDPDTNTPERPFGNVDVVFDPP
jgi:hypothetical protein